MSQKFYLCRHCKNLIGMINSSGVKMVCCGEEMGELVANTAEAATEKHIPIATREGNIVTVEVGSIPHPMEEVHHIEFIYLETKNGGQRRALTVGSPAKATFTLSDDEPVRVFAYCNLHGLWSADIG